ncbi:MAG: GNAT family N-acetyltransferase [Actinobacteria bacterium]|nr:GNAT family N-acetyltransferase [Actinomycetota bacterium]
MDALIIREARPGDGSGLSALHLDMGRYYVTLEPNDFHMPEAEGLTDALDPKAAASNERLWLVANMNGQIVGAIIAHLQGPSSRARWQLQPWASETTIYIDYLAVLRTHQRQGVATQLVAAAEAWGRGHGAVLSITDTYLRSPLSVPFWSERQGYTRRAVVLHKSLR